MDFLPLQTIVAHTLQAVLLAALGTAAAFAIRIDSAAVRYIYWRLLLATCLLAPWLYMWRPRPEVTSSTSTLVSTTATLIGFAASVPAETAPAVSNVDWTGIIMAVLLAGTVARLLWVGAGIVSLGRLRTLGVRVETEEDPEVAQLQEMLQTRADVRFVPGLRQPATFGFMRPVVLLPDTLRDAEPAIRRALVCHELFHVRRRDWGWVVAEEAVLAALWFNPAIWWLVARVRLTREESVDELTVLATGSRRTYVKALLAFAEDAPLAPAPAFAHRRHLVRRITLLAREAVMSSSRIVLSSAVMACVVLWGSWYAAAAFPIVAGSDVQVSQNAPGPLEQRATPVTLQNPAPRRTDYQAPDYPAEARAIGATGTIMFRVTLDEVGRIGEARRISFSIIAADPAVSIALGDNSPESLDAFLNKTVLRDKDGRVADNRALLRVVDAMTNAAIDAMRNWRYEAPAGGPVSFDLRVWFKNDGETSAVQVAGRSEALTVTATQVSGPLNSEGAVRIGGAIKAPTKVRDVRPVYPPVAMQAKVSGMVIIEARIGRDGAVEDARVLRSVPLLDQSALDAVFQWRFTPTLLNGVPTPVIMTVTVNFTIQ